MQKNYWRNFHPKFEPFNSFQVLLISDFSNLEHCTLCANCEEAYPEFIQKVRDIWVRGPECDELLENRGRLIVAG